MQAISDKVATFEAEIKQMAQELISREQLSKAGVKNPAFLHMTARNVWTLSKLANLEFGYMELGRKLSDVGERLARVEKICAAKNNRNDEGLGETSKTLQ